MPLYLSLSLSLKFSYYCIRFFPNSKREEEEEEEEELNKQEVNAANDLVRLRRTFSTSLRGVPSTRKGTPQAYLKSKKNQIGTPEEYLGTPEAYPGARMVRLRRTQHPPKKTKRYTLRWCLVRLRRVPWYASSVPSARPFTDFLTFAQLNSPHVQNFFIVVVSFSTFCVGGRRKNTTHLSLALREHKKRERREHRGSREKKRKDHLLLLLLLRFARTKRVGLYIYIKRERVLGKKMRVKTLAPNHHCLDADGDDQLLVQKIAKSLPWYGPKFSPHDVPNFYDVSGITENPEAFKTVIDVFVERYESQEEKPTKIAGFDARGFLFGPTIAMRLGACSILVVIACVFLYGLSLAARRARVRLFARSLARLVRSFSSVVDGRCNSNSLSDVLFYSLSYSHTHTQGYRSL